MSKANPNEVGGILRATLGTKDVVERTKRMKFKTERRMYGKEHELLRLLLLEAISWNA